LTVIGLSGSLTRPSRTTALVATILDRIVQQDARQGKLIELVDEAPHLFAALSRRALTGRAAAVVAAVEQAELLIVGTPVYRASYTGALKHLFDLVDHRAFTGKPILLAATGGTPLHGLVIEHALRPLFGFLNALTLPTGIYTAEQDFEAYRLSDTRVLQRIDLAAAEARVQLERDRVQRAA
jgi:FMN reductase